jgi:hypothetical protein
VLAAEAEPDHACGNATQQWDGAEQANYPGRTHAAGAAEYAADDRVLNEQLSALDNTGGEVASLLDCFEDFVGGKRKE